MERQRGIKVLSVVALVVAILGLTVAFATLSATLSINGTTKIKGGKWKIKFDNLQNAVIVGEAYVPKDGNNQNKAPVLTDTSITGVDVTLTKPGDSVSYTFDVQNEGTIDAKISSYIKGTPKCESIAVKEPNTEDLEMVCKNLVYTLTYVGENEGTEVKENDTLSNKSTRKMKLTIGYNGSSSDGNNVPSNDVRITGLDIAIIYSQD